MLRKILFALCFSTSTLVLAQTGTIKGTVTDAKTGEPVIGANAVIQGTTIGAATDIEGKFTINNVKPGTYNLAVSFITYKTHVIPDVVVEAAKISSIEIQLQEDATELQEVVIKGQADKTSESVLLTERKNSALIVQVIGSQELSRKGVGDVEAAVAQVTGVSKQQGVKNVFVRGLGDRYNSTSLNGLPLPSEDPAYKNISLGFFSTGIVNNIQVNKTFNAALFGDVAGANIDITSKELFNDREFSAGFSLGLNSQVANINFFQADGNNFFGSKNTEIPITNLNNYDFKNNIKPNELSGLKPNTSFSISGGRLINIGTGVLKLFGVASLNTEYIYKEGKKAFTNTEGQFRNDFNFKKYEFNTNRFALANANYVFGNDHSIAYNFLYVFDGKQGITNYRGFSLNGIDDIDDPRAYDLFVSRQQTNNNSLFVNQLITKFNITDKLKLEASGSFNTVDGSEPDRRQNYYIGNGEGTSFIANNSSPAFNHRFFSTLTEKELAGTTQLSYQLGKSKNNKVVAGFNIRKTDRNFDFMQFNFAHPQGAQVDPFNPESYFNQNSINNGLIVMETSRGTDADALTPFFYEGERTIGAGYANINYQIIPKLFVVAGARLENLQQKVRWSVGADEIRPNIPGDNTEEIDENYLLPSLSLKYDINDKNQLRLSASQTYTMPQFKEIAPFLYEDVNDNIFGNTALKPSENFNFDLKFEHYFSTDELFSVSGFYKKINNAINMIQVNSAALEFSYLNTGDATVFGGEIEFRKKIVNFKSTNESNLNLGANVSYLFANQTLRNDPDSKVAFIPSDTESGLEGASPILISADLTYTRLSGSGNKMTSSVVINYFSNRIYSLGSAGQNNIIERGVPTLDWITRINVSQRLMISAGFRNLLNPEYRLTKEIKDTGVDDLISSYKRGIVSSIGLSYSF